MNYDGDLGNGAFASISDVPVAGSDSGGGNGSTEQNCDPCAGDPVDLASGALTENSDDLRLAGRGPSLDWSRTYDSTSTRNVGLGYGWSGAYLMRVVPDPRGSTTVLTTTTIVDVVQENGAVVPFYRPNSSSAFTTSAGDFGTLTYSSGAKTWTFVRRQVTTFAFNSLGAITSITDLNGYSTKLAYNGSNQLSTVTDPESRVYTVAYNSTGQIASVTAPDSRIVKYTYDSSGNLATVTDAVGNLTKYGYDSTHHLTTLTDARGYVTTNVFDSLGRVTKQTDPLMRATTFVYSIGSIVTGSSITTQTEPSGETSTYSFTQGHLDSESFGSGAQTTTTSYQLDPSTLGVVAKTDGDGNTIIMSYDSYGNRASATDARGNESSYTYNSFDEPLTSTDAAGETTTITYDAKGNRLTVSRPLVVNGSTTATARTTYTYGDSYAGDVTAITNPNGNVTSYNYDAYGDLTSRTLPATAENSSGDKTVYNYSTSNGWLTSIVSPRGNLTGATASQYTRTYTYDADGRVTAVRDPLWVSSSPLLHAQTTSYDADGNVLTSTTAGGVKTTYTYDNADERTVASLPDGSTTTTSYTPDSLVLTQKDGRSDVIQTNTYTSRDQLASSTDGDGRTTSYTYDLSGNPISKAGPGGTCTAPASACTTYSYDSDYDLAGISYSDGVTPNVTFGYDVDDRRLSMLDQTGSSTWTYDSLGRVTQTVTGSGAAVGYGFDLDDNNTTITYPSGLGTVTRTYDAADRLTAVKDWLGKTTTVSYDADSNLTGINYPTTIATSDAFVFDATQSMGSETLATGSTAPVSLSYGRNGGDQVTSETSTGLSEPNQTNTYNYDGRLSTAGASALTYDDAGNPTETAAVATQIADAAGQTCWSSPTAISSPSCGTVPSGATSYTYNSRGDRTSTTVGGVATPSTWDQADRLVSVGSAASYTYDGSGLVATRTQGGTTGHFVWQENWTGNALLLYDGSTAYIYGVNGMPLEQISGSTASYLHHDQIGSTRAITSAAGQVVGTYNYTASGSGTHAGAASTLLDWQGQYQDSMTGKVYLRARWYDPVTSAFLSSDPAISSTLQPYQFGNDDPLDVSDNSGLKVRLVCTTVSINLLFYYTSVQQCVGTDSDGNSGTVTTKTHGFGAGLGASASSSVSVSDAPNLECLNGPSKSSGFGVGAAVVGAGYDQSRGGGYDTVTADTGASGGLQAGVYFDDTSNTTYTPLN